MAWRVTRRRAVARGLTLLGTLAGLAVLGSRSAAAQLVDPPSDVPWPDSPPSTPVPSAEDGESPKPVFLPDQDAEPADAPVPAVASTRPWGVPPVRVMIPALGVEAAVEAVGQDPDGAMSAPSDPDEVAWYQLGPGMGVPGNVVFAGHVNWNGRLRVFGLIDRLDQGDVIQVIDADGRGFEYTVESSHWVRAEGAPLEEIFAQPAEPTITLITCGGEYVASRREYLDRLIVRAKGA